MKWFISMLATTICLAQVKIITQDHLNAAHLIHNRLVDYYHLPESMVVIERGECRNNKNETILCINKKGELKLSSINQAQIKSFRIFR